MPKVIVNCVYCGSPIERYPSQVRVNNFCNHECHNLYKAKMRQTQEKKPNKIDRGILKQRQSLPLESKIAISKQRIENWYDHYDGDVYISFSGGADSTVLLDLVKNKCYLEDVPAVFINTGLEFPEVHKFALSKADVILQPRYTFKEVIKKYGWPVISKEQAQYIYEARTTKSEKLRDLRLNGKNNSTYHRIADKWKFLLDAPFKISHNCCNVMKKNPAKKYEKESGRHPYIGTLVEESKARETEYLKYGCNAFDKSRPTSTPLGFWTHQDILQYLKQENLEYAAIYGDIVEDENGLLKFTGEQRTGCVFCAFGATHEKSPNKFERLKETHPKLYNYCMNELGEGEVLDYIGIAR